MRFLKKIFHKEEKPKQTTFCWCNCGNELVSSKSFVSSHNEIVTYKCSTCHSDTEWLFDTPVPILIRVDGKIIQGEYLESNL